MLAANMTTANGTHKLAIHETTQVTVSTYIAAETSSNATVTSATSAGRNMEHLCHNPQDTSDPIVTAVFLYIFFVVGSAGNLLVILAISFRRSLWKPSNAYILCLVCCNFVTCAVICPFQAEVMRVGCSIPGCEVMGELKIITLLVSAVSLCAIAINRFILITFPPDTYAKLYSTKRTSLSIILILLIPMVTIMPANLTGTLRPGYYPNMGFCTPARVPETTEESKRAYTFAITMIGVFGFPICVIILVCYVGVWLKFRKSTQAAQRSSTQQSNGKRFKLTRNLFLLTVVFALCWLPDFFTETMDTEYTFTGPWMKIIYMLLFSNAVINPFLYALISDQFLKAYKNVFMCRITCKASVHPGNNTDCSSATM